MYGDDYIYIMEKIMEIFKSILFIICAIIVIYALNIILSQKRIDTRSILELKDLQKRIVNIEKMIDEKDKIIKELQNKIVLIEKNKSVKMKALENLDCKKLANEFTKEGF